MGSNHSLMELFACYMQTIRIDVHRLSTMEKHYRTAFVNSLAGYRTAALIGTQNAQGKTNLAMFSSLTHFGSNPAVFGIVSRPGVVERHTLENILENGHFTVNLVSSEMYKPAHQTSARYPRNTSEFDAVGLHSEFSTAVKAPYVQEAPVKIGLHLEEKHDIRINQTVLLIGSVVEVFIPENSLLKDGTVDMALCNLMAIVGLNRYYTGTHVETLPYAKP